VLITLAIIGIIAAITIPSLVANHQKTALEAQFAKGYRTIMQMTNLSNSEINWIDGLDWKNEYSQEDKINIVKTHFLPYLNVAKVCFEDSVAQGCLKSLDYKGLNGNNNSLSKYVNTAGVVLADGSTMYFIFWKDCLNTGTRCISITLDTNGSKKPNVVGYDYHTFNIFPYTNMPYPNQKYSHNDMESGELVENDTEEIYRQCSENNAGFSCTTRIILDGFKINY